MKYNSKYKDTESLVIPTVLRARLKVIASKEKLTISDWLETVAAKYEGIEIPKLKHKLPPQEDIGG